MSARIKDRNFYKNKYAYRQKRFAQKRRKSDWDYDEVIQVLKRIKVPKWLRKEVISRDGFICQICDKILHDDRITQGCHDEGFLYNKLTLDHIYPVSLGGGNSLDNLRVVCFPCGQEKDNKIERVDKDADKEN